MATVRHIVGLLLFSAHSINFYKLTEYQNITNICNNP